MDVLIRKATIKDVESIVDLCNECFLENTRYEFAKNVFLESEKDDKQIYLVGTLDNKIIAHAKLTIIPTMYEKMGTYSILNHVCVKPEYRRHNVATKLLDECTKLSKEKECVAMELWSMNFRVAAHECYKKYGFEVKDAKFFAKDLGDVNK